MDRAKSEPRVEVTDVELGAFCRRMGRDARQGEVGLVVGDEYFAIRDFAED